MAPSLRMTSREGHQIVPRQGERRPSPLLGWGPLTRNEGQKVLGD